MSSSQSDGESSAGQLVDHSSPRSPGTTILRSSEEHGLAYWIEIYAAALLAIATLLSAWSAYQATRWSGVQSIAMGEAVTARIESGKEFDLALEAETIDVNLFTGWLQAEASGQTELQTYYEEVLFRDDFYPFFVEWLEQDPRTNPDAYGTPFENPAYYDVLDADTFVFEDEALEKFSIAQDANQNSDNYILNTVFFASVLFFAGIASKFRPVTARIGLLSVGTLVLIVSLIRLIGLPVQ